MNEEMVRDRQEARAAAKVSIDRDAPGTRLIAGISVPDGPLITAAIDDAQRLSEPYLFNSTNSDQTKDRESGVISAAAAL